MIVCYADGGGLGHLTRIRAFLHTAHPGQRATIISASPYAGDPRVTGPHRILRPPPPSDGLAEWVATTLSALAPEELVVDAFPAGLHGELTGDVVPATIPTVTHLARLLRWDAYRPVLPPTARSVRFDRTWCIERLTDAHRDHLESVSSAVGETALVEPEPRPDPGGVLDAAGIVEDTWLVVHSGPTSEVAELLRYARETADLEGVRPQLVLVSPSRPDVVPPDVHHLDLYPAWPLFHRAARVITAAGCNAVRQMEPWRDRHRMVPFPRRFDDQYARAARAR